MKNEVFSKALNMKLKQNIKKNRTVFFLNKNKKATLKLKKFY